MFNRKGTATCNCLIDVLSKLLLKTSIRQWKATVCGKDTREVIEWFKNITNKQKHKFIVFDIKEFYPTITKDLLTKCLKFAEEKVQISNDDKKIIYRARKSLLFNEEGTWMKKDGLFDVTMGAYDGAEVCELVGTFLLDKISEKYEKIASVYIVMTGCQYLKTKAALNLKE